MTKSLKSRFARIQENRLLSIATMLDPGFKDKLFASNIIKTVKEMLEEEIWKIAYGEDNLSQEVRPKSPSPPTYVEAY